MPNLDPDKYEEHAISTLKRAGKRITSPRVQVVRAIGSSGDEFLSAYRLFEMIKAVAGVIDVVSVYRILETLEELNLVSRVSHGPTTRAGQLFCRLNTNGKPDRVICTIPHTGVVRQLEVDSDKLRQVLGPDISLAEAESGRELSFVHVELVMK